MSGKEKIVDILMRRDGLTREAAWSELEYVRSELMEAVEGRSGEDPEDVLVYELGLEPDYLFDIIW